MPYDSNIIANATGISLRWLQKWLERSPPDNERQEPEPGALLERALTLARALDSPFERAVTLAEVSRLQAEMGDQSGAISTGRDAPVSVAEIQSETWRDKAIEQIVHSQAEIGDPDGAYATARQLHSSSHYASALVSVADAQAKAGDISGALATARNIVDAESRAVALGFVAEAQAIAGDVASALVTAREIDHELIGAMTLSLITGAQAKTGDVAGAFATASGFTNEFCKVAALYKIASTQAESGDRQGAASTARNALATARDIDTATLRRIDDVMALQIDRSNALQIDEAMLLPNFGTSWLHRFLGPSWPSWNLLIFGIVVALAKAGDVDEALASANDINYPLCRAIALVAVIEAQIEAGDRDGALTTSREAITDLEKIRSQSERALPLAHIARFRAQAGDQYGADDTFQDALEIAPLDQLGAILRLQTEAGDVVTALYSAEAIKSQALRAMALAEIAAGLLKQE